ncbi:helix-turn-helix domain-containing protein [Mycoplasmatota bacterium WC30]
MIKLFSEKLRELRKEQGLSQEDLANKLDISRQSVSKWELGVSMPDLDNVIKLSELFDISTDYLLKDRKSNSDFSFYTTEKKIERIWTKYKTINLVFLTLTFAALLSLVILSVVEPIVYYNAETFKEYRGFMGYYFTYIEFKATVLVSLGVFILSLISIFLPEEKVLKLFKKK